MLDIPDDAFSEVTLPIITPIEINKTAMIIDTSMANKMFMVKRRPNTIAKRKNNVF